MESKEPTCLNLRKDIKNRGIFAVDHGYFSGITSLSGLVERALQEIMDRNNVPKSIKQEV